MARRDMRTGVESTRHDGTATVEQSADAAAVIFAVHHGEEPGGRPVLRRHAVADDEAERRVPGVDGVQCIPLATREESPAARPAVPRAVSRAAKRAAGMGTFFGAGSPEPGVRALAIRTGKFKTTDVFVEARFGKDKHYVHLRGAKNLPDTLNDADTVSVHSGMCLFSEGALRFWDENGDNPSLLRHLAEGPTSRLTRITTDDQLSLYEHTSLAHLPRAIADVATALPADLPLTVVIDIPRVQYYGYLLDAFRRGLATGELALEWFDLVDARHTRISRLFHDRVQAQLATACGDRSTTVVCPAPGLDLLAEPIRESVSKGVPPRHEDLVDLLAGSGDPVWDLLLRLESPTTSTELNDASYTVEILRSVAIHQDDGKNLAITVDSYEEFPRREHAQRVMDEVGPPGQLPVLGIYAAERLLNVDSQGQPTTPYLLDPGRYVADESGSTVDLFDLIDHLYA